MGLYVLSINAVNYLFTINYQDNQQKHNERVVEWYIQDMFTERIYIYKTRGHKNANSPDRFDSNRLCLINYLVPLNDMQVLRSLNSG